MHLHLTKKILRIDLLSTIGTLLDKMVNNKHVSKMSGSDV